MKKITLTLLCICSAYILVAQSPTKSFKQIQKQNTILNQPAPSTIQIGTGKNSTVSVPLQINQSLKMPRVINDSIVNIKTNGSQPYYFEKQNKQNTGVKKSVEQQFYSFHESAKQRTNLINPSEDLKIISVACDSSEIIHVKSQQYFKQIKVYGAQSYLHISPEKNVFTGSIYKIPSELSVLPRIKNAEAIEIVENNISQKIIIKALTDYQKQILQYNEPLCEMVIFDSKLAYEIQIRPNFKDYWRYFVDAQNGEILKSYCITNSDGPTTATATDLNNQTVSINTFLENGLYYMRNAGEPMYNAVTLEGIIETNDANYSSYEDLSFNSITSNNNTWNLPVAVSAHYNSTLAYRYFKNTFNRNSINGQGGDIVSFVNVNEMDGSSMENAFWTGQVAMYGNGGPDFYPLAGALDVVAHELGHGVISTTANLDYYGQSGAINEGYADIFGAMVDRENWLIGEKVTKTSFSPSGALRNMEDPHNLGTSDDYYWQPKHTSEMYIGQDDNAGVHTNSGIINYAYYLIATAITKEKAERIFYKALINYLTVSSNFSELRMAVLEATLELYGDTGLEYQTIKTSFDAVGIFEEEPITYTSSYEVNPGSEYLITYDTDNTTTETLFRSTTSGTGLVELSSTEMKGSVSITDDGTAALYVGTDSKIHVLSTDPYNRDEFLFSDEAIYDNVAISKDGNRMAAISTSADASIYVYDFISDQWKQFELYNPTTSENGIASGGVLYADAIEFDHTGEYIMYDAENQINSTNGEDLNYWDIGFIRVWNNETGTFAEGDITKLFNSLPENISIGNPTFSKNSPDIIAYDYLDLVNSEFAVLGANINTGQTDVIAVNNTLGYPSFNKFDNLVAFSSFDSNYGDVVAMVDLNANKISAADMPYLVIADAQWPMFYAEGFRLLVLPPAANFTADVKSGEIPLTVQFIDQSLNEPDTWAWAFQGGLPTTSTLQNPSVVYNRAGVFHVALTCANLAGSNTNTKLSYITVTPHVGLDPQVRELVSFYPNPAKNEIKIESKSSTVVSLFTLTGLRVANEINPESIDISKLPKGVYIIRIEVEGEVLTNTVVKE